MARTFISQPTQIFSSENYNDQLASGIALVSGSNNVEDDLNSLRSQVKQILWQNASGNWYDAVSERGINAINTVLDAVSGSVDTINGEITTIDGEITTIQGDISTINGEISTIVGEISTINGEIVSMSGSIGTINGEIVEIEEDITDLEAAVAILSGSEHRTRYNAGVTTSVAANANVTSGVNLDAPLGNYSGVTFGDKVNVFLNGILLLAGTNSVNSNDVYPGTTAATGDLKFPYHVRSGSQIAMEIYNL